MVHHNAGKRYKTKRTKRQLDRIHDDLSTPRSIESLKNQEMDEYKPGLGQYYCIHCAKYYQDNTALKMHLKGKVHKRRVKQLSVKPYDQMEADAASGYNLEKYIFEVKKHEATEPERLQMEHHLLGSLVDENDAKDKIREEQLKGPSDEVEMTA